MLTHTLWVRVFTAIYVKLANYNTFIMASWDVSHFDILTSNSMDMFTVMSVMPSKLEVETSGSHTFSWMTSHEDTRNNIRQESVVVSQRHRD